MRNVRGAIWPTAILRNPAGIDAAIIPDADDECRSGRADAVRINNVTGQQYENLAFCFVEMLGKIIRFLSRVT